MSWAKDAWGYILMYGKEAGQYLGLIEETSVQEAPVQVVKEAIKEPSGPGWMGKMFGGLMPARKGDAQSVQRGLPPPGTYKSGEVHGDYVKVGR